MQIIFNSPATWFLIGFLFLLLEFLVRGLVFFFFTVGACIVALLCLFSDPSISTQLIVFLVGSIASLLFFRKWVKGFWYKDNSSE